MAETSPWLDVIGIGEDGLDGLSPLARSLIADAEVIIGGDRHHDLTSVSRAERVRWPSPFDAMIETMRSYRGRRLVVLVTGDPLWYSVGARLLKSIPAAEIRFHPQLSAFQWAACRMGWSLADIDTVTVHGRADQQIIPFLHPGARLLVLTQDETTPASLATLITEKGYGGSRLTVLAALGGPREARFDGFARDWAAEVPAFHTMAIECVADPGVVVLPRTGLPDDAFAHDGKLTKRVVRAATLAKLAPVPNGILWDVGTGSGAVAIEWMRAAREAMAYGIEPDEARMRRARDNALALGAPKFAPVAGRAPEALADLPDPDAVFLGGGISAASIDLAVQRLKPFGRLVANAVTLESEAVLLDAFKRLGGTLERISVENADPVGPYHGWRPSMPVLQYAWQKPGGRT